MAFKLEKGKSLFVGGHHYKGPCEIPDDAKISIDKQTAIDEEKRKSVTSKVNKKDGGKSPTKS